MTLDGWIQAKERLPKKEDADKFGCVIVWHTYQGALITGWHQVPNNRFMTHWMPTPKKPQDDGGL